MSKPINEIQHITAEGEVKHVFFVTKWWIVKENTIKNIDKRNLDFLHIVADGNSMSQELGVTEEKFSKKVKDDDKEFVVVADTVAMLHLHHVTAENRDYNAQVVWVSGLVPTQSQNRTALLPTLQYQFQALYHLQS